MPVLSIQKPGFCEMSMFHVLLYSVIAELLKLYRVAFSSNDALVY